MPRAKSTSKGTEDHASAYSAAIQLMCAAESVTWHRLANFLTVNSVLVLTWAAVFASQIPPPRASFVLFPLATVGITTGLAWALLGVRGRKYHWSYLQTAKDLEERMSASDFPKPIVRAQQMANGMGKLVRSRTVLLIAPLLFSGLHSHLLLLIFTEHLCHHLLLSAAWIALITAATIYLAITERLE